MNKKGFALTETLVVVVFLVSIFTFIYVSIIPLIGKYESAINNDEDIDVVYKLFHIRKVLMSGNYRDVLKNVDSKELSCADFKDDKKDYILFCDKLMEQMELDNYVLVYAKSVNNVANRNDEIGEYATKYRSKIVKPALFLLDRNKNTIAHLYYDDTL